MSTPDLSDQLQVEYEENYPLYVKLCSELVTQLNELIIEEKINTAFPIESRVKTIKSIFDKCNRKNLCPSELGEISDIIGLRIILLFKRDLDKVCEILEKNFAIIKKEDIQQRLSTDQFGYGSIHYELKPPETWLSVPTLRRLQGIQAEVQVRTASQHIWASTSHILQYKRDSDVPIPIRRSINRAAALLEIVDLEFERVLHEREDYIEHIDKDKTINLNTDSLRDLLDKILPEENKSTQENYAELLEDLRYFDINIGSDLEDIISRNWNIVKNIEDEQVSLNQKRLEDGKSVKGTSEKRTKKNVYFKHVGLVRTALDAEFEDAFREYRSERLVRD